MYNRRDSGLVVIGVDDGGSGLSPAWLTDKQIATWHHDDIATTFASFADLSIEFQTKVFPYREVNVVVLYVQEFRETPVLCKKQFPVSGRQELKEGACYVRSRRKPETSEVSTQEDMRELLDLSLDKALRKWIGQAQMAGLVLGATPPTPTDRQQFEDQLDVL